MSASSLRLEDRRLCAGLQPHPGRQREYDWHHPGRPRHHLRGGFIIRAKFLNRIKEAFDETPTCLR